MAGDDKRLNAPPVEPTAIVNDTLAIFNAMYF